MPEPRWPRACTVWGTPPRRVADVPGRGGGARRGGRGVDVEVRLNYLFESARAFANRSETVGPLKPSLPRFILSESSLPAHYSTTKRVHTQANSVYRVHDRCQAQNV